MGTPDQSRTLVDLLGGVPFLVEIHHCWRGTLPTDRVIHPGSAPMSSLFFDDMNGPNPKQIGRDDAENELENSLQVPFVQVLDLLPLPVVSFRDAHFLGGT